MKKILLLFLFSCFTNQAIAFAVRFPLFSKFVVTSSVAPITSNGYKIYSFSSDGNFTVENGEHTVEYLIIGGGGGAASAGGGGAGGFKTGTIYLSKGVYSVTVGAGGSGQSNGGNSSVFNIISHGGGYGATDSYVGNSGGSGGGGYGAIRSDGLTWGPQAGGSGTTGEGNSGGSGVELAGLVLQILVLIIMVEMAVRD